MPYNKRVISPTTNMGEYRRGQEHAASLSLEPFTAVKKLIAVVSKVDPDRPRYVKAYNISDSSVVANGEYIRLSHSARDIADRWGTIRVGFLIEVETKGVGGSNGATGTVIGTEEDSLDEEHFDNDAEQGLYAIFAPGIGI